MSLNFFLESQSTSDSAGQNKTDNNATIGEGIVISGGRVIMQGGNASQDNAAVCVYCSRSFISPHALDVHLSRNQVIFSSIAIIHEIFHSSHVDSKTKLENQRPKPVRLLRRNQELLLKRSKSPWHEALVQWITSEIFLSA